MNERINQLRLEAGISRLHDEPKFMVAVSKEGTVIEPLDGLEKFAELIVRECMEWCDAHSTINGTAQQVRNSIKNHFGVEE
jgi:hypothetical protein